MSYFVIKNNKTVAKADSAAEAEAWAKEHGGKVFVPHTRRNPPAKKPKETKAKADKPKRKTPKHCAHDGCHLFVKKGKKYCDSHATSRVSR